MRQARVVEKRTQFIISKLGQCRVIGKKDCMLSVCVCPQMCIHIGHMYVCACVHEYILKENEHNLMTIGPSGKSINYKPHKSVTLQFFFSIVKHKPSHCQILEAVFNAYCEQSYLLLKAC